MFISEFRFPWGKVSSILRHPHYQAMGKYSNAMYSKSMGGITPTISIQYCFILDHFWWPRCNLAMMNALPCHSRACDVTDTVAFCLQLLRERINRFAHGLKVFVYQGASPYLISCDIVMNRTAARYSNDHCLVAVLMVVLGASSYWSWSDGLSARPGFSESAEPGSESFQRISYSLFGQ